MYVLKDEMSGKYFVRGNPGCMISGGNYYFSENPEDATKIKTVGASLDYVRFVTHHRATQGKGVHSMVLSLFERDFQERRVE